MLKSIDILIGLTVVMLVASMAVTVFTQFINGILNRRGRELHSGLADLVRQIDPNIRLAAAEEISRAVLTHPLVRGIGGMGSVIHREEFTKILVELAAGESTAQLEASAAQALKDALARNGITDPAATLRNVRNEALELEKSHPGLANNVRWSRAFLKHASSAALAKVNGWFDQTMDRVSERFTFHTRVVTFIGAVLVAGIIQLDTVSLINRLAMDDALRASLVASAQSVQRDQDYRQLLETRGVLLLPHSVGSWLDGWGRINPFGVVISAMLLSLGAPFWYSALGRLLALRSVLAEKDDNQRKQRQETGAASAAAAAGGVVS
jgi:hypothetical protein